jgi:CTP:molybdopterin cytidylyltransferase MocA
MGPIGELLSKCLFPVDGMPVVAGLIADLRAAFSCTRVVCVTGHLAWQVEQVLPGYAEGVELVFVRERGKLGTAAATLQAIEDLELRNFVYAHGDIRLLPPAVERLRVATADLPPGGSLVATTTLPIAPTHPVLRLRGDKVVRTSGHERFSVGVGLFQAVPLPSEAGDPARDRESIEAWLARNTQVLDGARGVDLGDEWLHLEDLGFYVGGGSRRADGPRRLVA